MECEMTDKKSTGDTLAPKQTEEQKRVLKRCLRYLAEARPKEKQWRPRSQEGLAIYYNDQWKKGDKATLEDRGQAAVTINRTRITINMMLGLQAAQPIDPRMKPVGKNDDNMADMGTASLKHVWGVNEVNEIGLKVYFYQVVYSYGVAYTGFYVRNRDRRSEPVQVMELDPREVTRDPHSKRDDLTDCRWVDWKRKLPVEEAQELYPKFKDALARLAGRDEEKPYSKPYPDSLDGVIPGPSDWEALSEWNKAHDVDQDAGMVTLHELWERRWEKGTLIEHRDGWVHEWDPSDPAQAGAVFEPTVKAIYRDVDVPRIYYHVFCGDLLLMSEQSPYKHGQFPFVFLVNELDHNDNPISEVEYLKDLQREINHRRSKFLHELSNQQLVVNQELLGRMKLTQDDVAALAADPAAVWIGNPTEVSYLKRDAMTTYQFQLMQDSKAEMQAVSGANDDLMGYDSTSKSGVAKDIQREQGVTLQRPRESKLKGFYKRLAEQLFQLIQQAWTDEKVVRLTDELGQDRLIAVNQREVDPVTGMSRVLNDITQARFETAIDFDPWTPTTREKVGEILKDLADKEPDPIARRALLMAAIKALPIPNKVAILEAYQQASMATMPPPGMAGVPPGVDPSMAMDLAAQMGEVPPVPVSPYAPQLAA
jgi:hypothetical protein